MRVEIPGTGTGEPCGSPHRRPNWAAVLTDDKKAACWRLVRLYFGISNPTAHVGQRGNNNREFGERQSAFSNIPASSLD